MEINNKIVNGIYLYEDNIKYNKGDLVVFKESLYKVKKDVINIKPVFIDESKDEYYGSSDEYYELYLSNEIGSTEDFFNYLNNKSSQDVSDKSVSIRSLGQILNTFYNGFNEKGLIQNTITKDGVFIKDYVKNYFTNYNFKLEYSNPLDSILVEPNLNNCIFLVDFDVVKDIIGTVNENKPDNVVLLRQFTYLNNNRYTRIQELINYFDGTTKYRFVTSETKNLNFNLTNVFWKTKSLSSDFIDRVDSIVMKANNIINNNTNEENTKIVNNPESKLKIVSKNSLDRNNYSTNLSETTEIITIIYHRVLSNNINESRSITVNIKDSIFDNNNTVKYVAFTDEDLYIRISKSKQTIEENKSELVIQIVTDNCIIIDKIYGRN